MVAPPGSDIDQVIERYGALQDDRRDLEVLAELAALVCDVPHAAINLITSEHQHQVAATGIDPSVCSREDSMCAVVLDQPRTVVSRDASRDPRFADNPFVDGTTDSVRFYASAPLVTPQGATIGRLCVFDGKPHDLAADRAEVLQVVAARVMDVLELRLRGRQLAQSLEALSLTQEELRRSNELLSLFAGQVSHDLRSPLTAILANAELLADEPAIAADPDAAELVAATRSAGTRMAAMIDRILAQARSGGPDLTATVALDDVLDQVLADLAPAVAGRSVELTRTALPSVRGDEQQLYAVLLNLLSNAIKFTPLDRAPRIALGAERDGEHWRISVADNGRGIPEAHRHSVFDLHARADEAVEGSGIGLATTRRAVEAHGGRIGIERTGPGGTVFWFTLPA